jgi:hypothetical protein
MAEILQFGSKHGRRRKPTTEVGLAIEKNLYSDADLRNLIDTWIVPKMIDDWIARTGTRPEPLPTEDNGDLL